MRINNNHELIKIESETQTSLKLKQLNKITCSYQEVGNNVELENVSGYSRLTLMYHKLSHYL